MSAMLPGGICASTARKVCEMSESAIMHGAMRTVNIIVKLLVHMSLIADITGRSTRWRWCMCCTGYFPGNGHEYCWPCLESKSASIILSITMLIGILFLWSLLSFGISSRSIAIFLNYLQVINMIQVRLEFYAWVTTFGFRITRRTRMVVSVCLRT